MFYYYYFPKKPLQTIHFLFILIWIKKNIHISVINWLRFAKLQNYWRSGVENLTFHSFTHMALTIIPVLPRVPFLIYMFELCCFLCYNTISVLKRWLLFTSQLYCILCLFVFQYPLTIFLFTIGTNLWQYAWFFC